MNIIKKLIVIIFVIAFLSCEKTIDYDGSQFGNFMVLNANLNADSLISCGISSSTNLSEPYKFIVIQNAEVKLYKDKEFVTNMVFVDESEYVPDGNEGAQDYYGVDYSVSKYIPEDEVYAIKGAEYTIEVQDKSFAPISASTHILEPANAEIVSVDISEDEDYYGWSSSYLKMKIKVHDFSGEDYYRIVINSPVIIYNYETGETLLSLQKRPYSGYLESDDPVLNFNKISENEFEDVPYNSYGIFNDFLFDGDSYILSLQLYNESSGLSEVDKQMYLEGIEVDIQKITKGLYRYYKSVDESTYYGDNPFSEPVKIYSNVEGGAGILGASTSNILKLVRE
ncbi:DUF4249 domain-containing protein [Saccharicrinis aurantiacus]|uniref:DUF4249 domain-containing protein n=1 Tax=Saccharicrinis aurantiacus TaxID=1849719 RepID=UPI00094FE5DF|nr:DUF4249 domain-containing protein [Saccharicrinis aurantiacus]